MREGKTQGGIKPPPKGPRPNVVTPPPQRVKVKIDLADLIDAIHYLSEHGGSFNVRNEKYARYQFEIPGLMSVQYADLGKTCSEFVSIMKRYESGDLRDFYEEWKEKNGIS